MSVDLPQISADPSQCRHCGSHVPRGVRRVFGDSDDVAHRCRKCDSDRRIARGSAAGVDVSIPDPETNPGRQGNDAHAVADGGLHRGQTTAGWLALVLVFGLSGLAIWGVILFA